jgi:hypothetical protein
MAAEGDVGITGDYLAVQKLNADPNTYNATNYLIKSRWKRTQLITNSSISLSQQQAK